MTSRLRLQEKTREDLTADIEELEVQIDAYRLRFHGRQISKEEETRLERLCVGLAMRQRLLKLPNSRFHAAFYEIVRSSCPKYQFISWRDRALSKIGLPLPDKTDTAESA